MWETYYFGTLSIIWALWFVCSETLSPTELLWRKKGEYYRKMKYRYMKKMEKELEDWRN